MESGEQEIDRPSQGILRFLRNPIFLILFIGLAIRFVCAPFLTYDFDMYHWGVIMENINSGNGLYELTGYFYTPVWGYVMGFIDAIWNTFLTVDVYGVRVTELFEIENLRYIYHVATETSPEFNVAMKVPMIVSDVLVGYLLYRVVGEWTGDQKKSVAALGLWFLCPIVIYMSGIQGMFDTMSALLMFLCAILFWKRYYFLGGVILSFATLLKFFPGFCLLVLIALIIVRHREEKAIIRNLAVAALGGIVGCLVILMPNIIDGTVIDTLSFALGRMSGMGSFMDSFFTYVGMAIAFGSMFYFGYRMYADGSEDTDRKFFLYTMFALIGGVLVTVSPQYVIVAIPFLIFHVTTCDRRYSLSLVLVGLFAMLYALSLNNFSLLASSSEFFGYPAYSWIISSMQTFEGYYFAGFSPIDFFCMVFSSLLVIGMLLMYVVFFSDKISKLSPRAGAFIDRICSIKRGD